MEQASGQLLEVDCALLVAEHPTTRRLTQVALRKVGIESRCVAAGDTLDEIRRGRVGLVLIDLDSDAEAALRLGRRLCAELGSGRPSLVGMLRRDDAALRRAASEAGVDDFLVLPARPSELRRISRRSLSRSPEGRRSEPPPALDRARLDTLLELEQQVDEEVVRPLVLSFLESAPGVLAELRQASAAQDWMRVRSELHGFLGRALNLGAVACSKTCRALQDEARARNGTGFSQLLPSLEEDLQDLGETIRRYLEEVY